jgi:hypothetical protein
MTAYPVPPQAAILRAGARSIRSVPAEALGQLPDGRSERRTSPLQGRAVNLLGHLRSHPRPPLDRTKDEGGHRRLDGPVIRCPGSFAQQNPSRLHDINLRSVRRNVTRTIFYNLYRTNQDWSTVFPLFLPALLWKGNRTVHLSPRNSHVGNTITRVAFCIVPCDLPPSMRLGE